MSIFNPKLEKNCAKRNFSTVGPYDRPKVTKNTQICVRRCRLSRIKSGDLGRSDTMDDLVTHPVNLDDDDEKKGGGGDLFSPIDIGSGVGGPSSLADDATNGKENSLEFEEDDKPFQVSSVCSELQFFLVGWSGDGFFFGRTW